MIGYYILLIITLICLSYTATIMGLKLSDTIEFSADSSGWMWFSLGVAGMFSLFGLYYIMKSTLGAGSKSTKESTKPSSEQPEVRSFEKIEESPKIRKNTKIPNPTNYGSVSELTSNYGKPPRKVVMSDYGYMPSLDPVFEKMEPLPNLSNTSEYEKIDESKFKKPIVYGDVPRTQSSKGYGSVPAKQIYGPLPSLDESSKSEESQESEESNE